MQSPDVMFSCLKGGLFASAASRSTEVRVEYYSLRRQLYIMIEFIPISLLSSSFDLAVWTIRCPIPNPHTSTMKPF